MRKSTILGAAALAAMAAVGVAQDASAQATTSWSGAPRTREEDREFKINGRMQYDVFSISQDFSDPAATDVDYSGSFMRRAFFGVEGRFTRAWRYNVKFDLGPSAASAADDGGEIKLDDAYLEYAGESFSVFIGQQNAVSHLEDRTSSNYTPFNERSMIDQAFGYGKIFGIGVLTNGGNWSLGVSAHGDTLNNSQSSNTEESTFVIARGTWAPIYSRTPDGTTLLHLGVLARQRDGGSGSVSYSARPNMNSLTGLGSTISSSGTFGSDTLYGLEIAGQWNAFGMTAEFQQLEAHRGGAGSDGTIEGGYVDLFWSPTGESRNYTASDGSFGRISPRATLGSDGIGHIMLSARYEWLDLTDTAFGSGASTRGEQTGYIAGVTWAPIGYVKFQLNYANYEVDRAGTGTSSDQDLETISLRTQFDW